MNSTTPGATTPTPSTKRDTWAFGRSDRWGLAALLGIVSVGAVAAYLVAPLATWASGGVLRVPFFSEVTVPALDRAGIDHGEADYTVAIEDPSVPHRILDLLPGLVWLALILLGCILLLRVLNDIGRGDPFRPANVRRLRTLAALLAIGWPVASIAQSLAAFAIVADLELDGLGPRAAFTLPLLPILGGLVVALLAEAFKAGSRLRDDVDGLV